MSTPLLAKRRLAHRVEDVCMSDASLGPLGTEARA
jgi:hypothetical protein